MGVPMCVFYAGMSYNVWYLHQKIFFNCSKNTKVSIVVGVILIQAGNHPLNSTDSPSCLNEVLIILNELCTTNDCQPLVP
jgi:hypothetical protein